MLKTKDLKTDCKKATKQGSRYCSVESLECVIHMTGDTVQLAFNYATNPYFDSAKRHSYSNSCGYIHMESK